MTPHEVRARCAELGTPIVQSTLANYKAAGLIFPPLVQSLGRKSRKVSTYREEVPYEIYTAQRLSGRDFGFTLDSVALFRIQWLAGGNRFPDGSRSTCTLAAARCCGRWFITWPRSALR